MIQYRIFKEISPRHQVTFLVVEYCDIWENGEKNMKILVHNYFLNAQVPFMAAHGGLFPKKSLRTCAIIRVTRVSTYVPPINMFS